MKNESGFAGHMLSSGAGEGRLLELAERCEAATGPDRELDAAIAYQHLGFWTRNEGHPLGRQSYDTHGIAVELPRYTASLDAAVTLVPEGWHIARLEQDWRGLTWTVDAAMLPLPSQVDAYDKGRTFGVHSERASAVTGPLAICAAALRARAATVPKTVRTD